MSDKFKRIAGVDEAGRGPLAGPVAVATVILDPNKPIDGLADSKKLSATRRNQLFDQIQQRALAWHIELVSHLEIDQHNILQATLIGMQRAVQALTPAAELALIDGNRLPKNLPCPAQAIVRGDAIEQCIMAASILAKVSRDRYMQKLHLREPQFGFNKHKGYPTAEHLTALHRHGPGSEHRHSFAPVRNLRIPD